MNAEEKRQARKELGRQVIQYLNEKAERKFDCENEGTLQKFTATWSYKYGIKQYKGVIDYLVLKWKGDKMMDYWLRPSTIFGKYNFPEYLGEARSLYLTERMKHRLTPFNTYLPVHKADSIKLNSFANYDPHAY